MSETITMDYYHIWADLKQSNRDLEFAANLDRYLGVLKERGLIADFQLTRRKLGFGPSNLGEFHVTIATENLEQLDRAFQQIRPREGEVEGLHAAVYSAVTNLTTALYRDFPDR